MKEFLQNAACMDGLIPLRVAFIEWGGGKALGPQEVGPRSLGLSGALSVS